MPDSWHFVTGCCQLFFCTSNAAIICLDLRVIWAFYYYINYATDFDLQFNPVNNPWLHCLLTPSLMYGGATLIFHLMPFNIISKLQLANRGIMTSEKVINHNWFPSASNNWNLLMLHKIHSWESKAIVGKYEGTVLMNYLLLCFSTNEGLIQL